MNNLKICYYALIIINLQFINIIYHNEDNEGFSYS